MLQKTKTLIEDNTTAVGVGLLVAMGVQIVSIAFGYCRKRQLEDRVDDADLRDTSNAKLLDSSGMPAPRSDRAAVAQQSYRERKAGMYAKYDGVIKR